MGYLDAKRKYQEEPQSVDDYSRLQCTYLGCSKRWSVHVNGEKPKCSEHQWIGSKKQTDKTWYESDNF